MPSKESSRFTFRGVIAASVIFFFLIIVSQRAWFLKRHSDPVAGNIVPSSEPCPSCPPPPISPILGLTGSLRYLQKRCGYQVHGVIDVGANNGQWSLDLKSFLDETQKHAKSTQFLLMEGNDMHSDSLTKTGFPFHIGLVAETEKEVKFYKVADPSKPHNTGNSMFKEAGWSDDMHVVVKALTLDHVVKASGLGPFNFMKIDVQGAEVQVLNGGKETLQNVEVIATEASIQNYNQGGATLFELHSAMENLGFAMYDIIDLIRWTPTDHTEHVVQLDFLWVKKESSLWSQKCTGFPARPGYGTKD